MYATFNKGNPSNIKILYPEQREEEPEDYPAEVRDNYKEAVRSMKTQSYKASVIMTRSALQAAMREQNATGRNLSEEIDDLASKHIIPSSVQQWAHEIRKGGNLVAHPKPSESVTKDDAEEILALLISAQTAKPRFPAPARSRSQSEFSNLSREQ